VDENGSPIVWERIYLEDESRYMAICKEGPCRFHRFYVGVTLITLPQEVVGFGYKACIYGDVMVMAELAETKALSFRLQLEDYRPIYTYYDSNRLTSGQPITLRIRNYDVENFSENRLYAQVSLTLKDGTVVETEEVALSFRWLTEQVNANYTDYTPEQLASFSEMLKTFAVAESWDIPNIMQYAQVN
jgi:hypothetical protein